MTYSIIFFKVRFKPVQLPARVSDSDEPIFGKYDMTNEGMFEKRRRAHELYKEQVATVEQRKRDAILKRLSEQKEEEGMLTRTKTEYVPFLQSTFQSIHFLIFFISFLQN